MLQKVNITDGDFLDLSSGKYLIEKVLGEGGFGSVYKARKEEQSYAIKLNRIWELFPDDREEIRKRIKQEFEISNTIQSCHIVHTYSMDEIHENPVLVMDYCSGGSLRDKIGNSYSTDVLDNIALQILNGLNVLHSFNIIHRDIKPENILFREDLAMLTDFGISANLKHRLTRVDIRGHALKVFATLSYSPPEQSQKSKAYKMTGPTTDIFSFGVIMYELITKGNLPYGTIKDFEADSKSIEEKKIKGEWDSKNLMKSSGLNYWYTIIKTCLNPDPKQRFQNTNDIIDIITSEKPALLGNNLSWKIQIIDGNENGKEYHLSNLSKYKNKNILTVGRFDHQNPFLNDIAIKDSTNYISSHHGTFECLIINNSQKWCLRDGQWYLKEGEKGWHISRNGIEVNSVKIDKDGVLLNNNDTIKIGKTKIRVYCI